MKQFEVEITKDIILNATLNNRCNCIGALALKKNLNLMSLLIKMVILSIVWKSQNLVQ